jgi:hypothetical protein
MNINPQTAAAAVALALWILFCAYVCKKQS